MDINLAAVLVAVIGAGGIGAAIREIVSVITLARKGVSGKEDRRRGDIVAQRDHAQQMQRAAESRADRERIIRIAWQEHASRQRRRLIEAGIEPDPVPDIDETTEPGHRPQQT